MKYQLITSILVLGVSLTSNLFGQTSTLHNSDTFSNSKVLKNTLSIGISNINFFDKTKASWSTKSRDYYGLIGSFSLSYKRKMNKNYFYSMNVTPFLRNGYYAPWKSDYEKGNLLSRAFGIASVDFGRSSRTIKFRNFAFGSDYSVKFLYRFGTGDEIFLESYSSSVNYASEEVNFSGVGLGITTNFHFIISNRITFSMETGFCHVFENGKYEELSPPFFEYYKYTPPRNMLVFQPKIGILF